VAAPLELGLIGGVGDLLPAGEHAAMTARNLTRVERDGRDLALGDANVDALPDEAGVQGVVVAIDADIGLRRDPDHQAAIKIGGRHREWAQRLALLLQALNRTLAQRPVNPRVRSLCEPLVELVLKVELSEERAARLEAGLHEPCSRSTTPFASQSPGSRIRDATGNCPQKPANSKVGRP
jgi:hypothetical protein